MMANIIQFGQLKNRSGAKKKKSTTKPCANPIVIKRIDSHAFSISFHESYFDAELVELVLSLVSNGMNWSAYYHTRTNRPSVYMTYKIEYIYLGNDPEAVMATAVYEIVHNVYFMELGLSERRVNIFELAQPRQFTSADSANISSKTVSVLYSAGIKSVQELIQFTREDLCHLPGMTTEEIVKLEKSLITRGFSLLEEVPHVSNKFYERNDINNG